MPPLSNCVGMIHRSKRCLKMFEGFRVAFSGVDFSKDLQICLKDRIKKNCNPNIRQMISFETQSSEMNRQRNCLSENSRIKKLSIGFIIRHHNWGYHPHDWPWFCCQDFLGDTGITTSNMGIDRLDLVPTASKVCAPFMIASRITFLGTEWQLQT